MPSSAAVEDDRRLDAQRVLELLLQPVPEGASPRVAITASKSDRVALRQAIGAVELAIGEPEAVVGARIEPAIVALRLSAQDVCGRAEVAGDAVDETRQIVGAGVEDHLAFQQAVVEGAQRGGAGAVEALASASSGRRGEQAEIPGLLVEFDGAARILQVPGRSGWCRARGRACRPAPPPCGALPDECRAGTTPCCRTRASHPSPCRRGRACR